MIKTLIFVAIALLPFAALRTVENESEQKLADAKTLKFLTSDGEIVEANVDAAKMSVFIKDMLLDLGDVEDADSQVELWNIESSILTQILKYAEHHKNDPIPTVEDNEQNRNVEISQWDEEFMNSLDQHTLFEVLKASNFLDIKGLLDVCCKTVANMIKGKSPEEIRATFNIKNDFTPEEEAEVRKGNSWSKQ